MDVSPHPGGDVVDEGAGEHGQRRAVAVDEIAGVVVADPDRATVVPGRLVALDPGAVEHDARAEGSPPTRLVELHVAWLAAVGVVGDGGVVDEAERAAVGAGGVVLEVAVAQGGVAAVFGVDRAAEAVGVVAVEGGSGGDQGRPLLQEDRAAPGGVAVGQRGVDEGDRAAAVVDVPGGPRAVGVVVVEAGAVEGGDRAAVHPDAGAGGRRLRLAVADLAAGHLERGFVADVDAAPLLFAAVDDDVLEHERAHRPDLDDVRARALDGGGLARFGADGHGEVDASTGVEVAVLGVGAVGELDHVAVVGDRHRRGDGRLVTGYRNRIGVGGRSEDRRQNEHTMHLDVSSWVPYPCSRADTIARAAIL